MASDDALLLWRMLWLPPRRRVHLGSRRGGEPGRQAVGRWQAHPGVSKAGLRDGRRVQVGKHPEWFPWTSWLMGCGRVRFLQTHSLVDTPYQCQIMINDNG